MNNSKSGNKKTPIFQTSSQPRFQERTVGQKRVSRGETEQKNFSQKRPHLPAEDRTNNARKPFRTDHNMQEVKEMRVTELSLNKAGNENGQVKVMVKGTKVALQPKVKKTGALSPRAPEKIKKNRAEEMKVYGENACLALFKQRPESIVRVWTTVQMAHKVGALFSYLAANKKVYHVVDAEELGLVSGTEHHGGICMLVKKMRPFTLQGYLDVPRSEDCMLLLDAVQNAQNVGAVLRTCAYYGVKSVVAENVETLLSGAALRVAEGGAEYVRLLESHDNLVALEKLRQAGYQIIHISSQPGAISLDKVRLKNKVVFLLSEGSTESLVGEQDCQVCLSRVNPLGTGLNIAVNAGILLSKWHADSH